MGLMTLVITAGVPIFIRYLQKADAQQKEAAQLRERELDAAERTLQEVSRTLSGLLFRMREALYLAVYDTRGQKNATPEAKEKTWASYREVMIQWEEGRAHYLAAVEEGFGEEAAEKVTTIDASLRTLMRQVAATYYGRTDSQHLLVMEEGNPNDFRAKFMPLYEQVDECVQELNRIMIEAIQKQEVGGLRLKRDGGLP